MSETGAPLGELFRKRGDGRPLLSPRFIEAVEFAAHLHAAQVRKGTTVPYMAHLIGVCSLVLEAGGDEEEAIAALLHDAIEDHPRGGKTADEIRRRFGARVYEIVEACTDAMTHPKRPWIERKRDYVARARTHSPSARRVSLADKVHNTRAIVTDLRTHGPALWDRFHATAEETVWYYRSLADTYVAQESDRLARELDRVVTELETLVDSA